MRYHNITKDDMLNGEGLRVVLWVSGCEHACKGCHNPITWNVNDGLLFDEEAKAEIFTELKKKYVSGITFSGGDPLHPLNRKEITSLAKEIKESFSMKTIWLYTGYDYEEVADLDVFNFVDVLVDGRFVEALKSEQKHWGGSTNQRVIDIPQSKKLGKIVLYD